MGTALGVGEIPFFVLSFAISVITVYTLLDIGSRIFAIPTVLHRVLTIICGAFLGGAGFLTVEYIGVIYSYFEPPQQSTYLLIALALVLSSFSAGTMLAAIILPMNILWKKLLGSLVAGTGFYGLNLLIVLSLYPATSLWLPNELFWWLESVLLVYAAIHIMTLHMQGNLSLSVRQKVVGSCVIGACWLGQQFVNWYAGGSVLIAENGSIDVLAKGMGNWVEIALLIFLAIALSNLFLAYQDRRRAVKLAEYKNNQYESLFQHNPNVVCTFNLQGHLLAANPSFKKITGFDPEEFLNLSYQHLVYPEEIDVVDMHIDQLTSGEAVRFEVACRHRSGRRIDMQVTSIPVVSDGEIIAVNIVAEDITARKQMEDALRESEAKYRFFAENMKDLISVYSIEGIIQYASPSHVDLLQIPIEKYVGRHVLEFVHPDEAAKLREINRRLMKTRDIQSFTCRFRGANEGWIFLEGTAIPIEEADGKIESVAVIARDVTQERVAKQQLAASEQRYRSLFEHNPDAVFSINASGHLTSVNPATQLITGFTPEEMKGKPFVEFILPEELERTLQHYRCVRKGVMQNFEVTIIHKEGHLVTLQLSIVPIVIGKHISGVFGIAKDITEQKQAEATIHHLAYHDALTDLPNRRLFKEKLTDRLEEVQLRKSQLAVMFLDLDRFKVINDTLGHDVGDRLLQHVSRQLKMCVGPQHILARMGGDEFTVLLQDIADKEQIIELADAILQVFAVPFDIGGHQLHVTTSIGIAMYPLDGNDVDTLMKNADLAMYRAKEKGKNRYQFYSEVANAKGMSVLMLENQLHKALVRDEFVLHYQPQIALESGLVTGMEALLRWEHPELGLLTPKAFIELAEETGLMPEINKWALHEACRQCCEWRRSIHTTLTISVNLSIRLFQHHDFVNDVQRILEDTGLPADALTLELKESATMYDETIVREKLRILTDLGIRIAIDNYGAGHSSIDQLRRLPIDLLKIDASFIKEMNSESGLAIVQALSALAASLNREVLAEGVETIEQLTYLKEIGCAQAQGYLFSHPLPADTAQQMLSLAAHDFERV